MADEAREAAEAVLADRQWPVVVHLKFPIEFGTQRIAALEFRKGKAGDLRGIQIGEMPTTDKLLELAGRLCGQPRPVMDGLDPDDTAEVLAIALGFIGRCQGAGKRL